MSDEPLDYRYFFRREYREFMGRLGEIKGALEKKFFITEAPSAPLYHYTNVAGLIGIINSQKMWATNIKYLNDASEISYASNLIVKRVRALQLKIPKPYDSADKDPIHLLLDKIAKMYSKERTLPDVYVSCFCEEGDLLSQWRAYGADGGGFSIGVDFTKVDFGQGGNGRQFFLTKVIYTCDDQISMIDETLDESRKLLEGLLNSYPDNSDTVKHLIAAARDACVSVLRQFLYTFKHVSFKQEQEWRLVAHPGSQNSTKRLVSMIRASDGETADNEGCDVFEMKFRPSLKRIIPYVEIPVVNAKPSNHQDPIRAALPDGLQKRRQITIPISSVVCGPTHHQTLGKASLYAFLKNKGYEIAERDIGCSDIPLVHT